MALSRRLRRWLSVALATTILFTQVALSAYACPTAEPVLHHDLASVPMAGMPDCHGAEGAEKPVPPQLCKAHCANDAQSEARTISPDLQPNPASMALLQRVILPPAELLLPVPMARVTPSADPPDPLPLYLSLLVLRN